MGNVAVPFQGGYITMSVTEAEEMVKNLTTQLAHVRVDESELKPPRILAKGLIDRKSFYQFFVQLYPDPNVLRNHAGKLFGRIVLSVTWDEVSFKVVCLTCATELSGKAMPARRCCRNNGNLAVSVTSLKKHADRFMHGGYRLVAGSLVDDLRILLSRL